MKNGNFSVFFVTHREHAAQQEQAQLANASNSYYSMELTARFMRLDRVAGQSSARG